MQLDTWYQSPGFLLLARSNDGDGHGDGDGDDTLDRLGCVGVRSLDESSGEVRRLFVRDRARGTGLGRELCERLLREAHINGFERLVLNTLPAMTEAIRLYRSLGFVPCEPYVDEPLDGTLYFELVLHSSVP